MFTDMLQVKAGWAGRVLAFVDPKYTSQVCSNCGIVQSKTLEERWHSCVCGCELDRDTNAARNILKKHAGAGSVPQMNPRGESVEALAFQAWGTSQWLSVDSNARRIQTLSRYRAEQES